MPPTRGYALALAACAGQAFSGRCFRVVGLESFTSKPDLKLLFDLGPKIAAGGQRFSPPGKHRGLYVSTELPTAGAEFADGLDRWRNGDHAKHVAFDMDVQLNTVLDLTSAAVRRTLEISKKAVQSPWEGYAILNGGAWPSTWQLGHDVFASGRFDGILYPSTKSTNGVCLLIFTERLQKGLTRVSILRDNGTLWEQLP